MFKLCIFKTGVFASVLLLLVNSLAYGQVPDWKIDLDEQAIDSLAQVDYPYVFPFFAQNVVRKGFDLPYPVGISFNYYQHNMGVLVDELALGINESPLMPVAFFEFNEITDKVRAMSGRLDLWLFPFFNIYGVVGQLAIDADVTIAAPFPLETKVDMDGLTYGGGGVFAFGLQQFWTTVDGNIVWNDLDAYNEAVKARTLSFRLGRTFGIVKNDRLQVWLGAMYQNVDSEVIGKYLLSDIVSEDMYAIFADYQNSEWYNDLDPTEQAFVDGLIATIQQGDPTTELNYQVHQHPEDDWHMLAGAQYEVSKRWFIQVEGGFLGSRTSILSNINYRFPL